MKLALFAWLFALLMIAPAYADVASDLQAAEAGDAEAQHQMGVRHSRGDGVRSDLTAAAEWWEKAATQAHAGAQTALGRDYERRAGYGGPYYYPAGPDLDKAVVWYERAVEQNEPEALFRLGLLYASGRGVPYDPDLALTLYRRAAAQDHQAARAAVAQSERIGYACRCVSYRFQTDTAGRTAAYEVARIRAQIAESDDPLAETGLAYFYFHGLGGIEKDEARAAAQAKTVVAAGRRTAEYALALLYLHGDGVEQNLTEAARLLHRVAETGLPNARTQLALMYLDGSGVEQDVARALAISRDLTRLGRPFGAGFGFDCSTSAFNDPDPRDMARVVALAADDGFAPAQFIMGWAYEEGLGVPRDREAAATLYRMAAAEGMKAAQQRLGRLFALGAGVPQDDVEAYVWLTVGLSGNRTSQIDGQWPQLIRKEVEDRLTQESRARADHRIATALPDSAHKQALQRKAEAGDADAQFALGQLHRGWTEGPPDTTAMLTWYTRAAEHGHADAQFALGELYAKGARTGQTMQPGQVPRDVEAAFRWYRLAAHQRHLAAQLALARALSMSVPWHDADAAARERQREAYVWWHLAAAQGAVVAAHDRDRYAQRMTAEDVADARRQGLALLTPAERAKAGAGGRRWQGQNGGIDWAGPGAPVCTAWSPRPVERPCVAVQDDFTIRVEPHRHLLIGDGSADLFRLGGIELPPQDHALYDAALAYAREICTGHWVRIVQGNWLEDDGILNGAGLVALHADREIHLYAELLARGLAKLDERFPRKREDTTQWSEGSPYLHGAQERNALREAEASARTAGIGLWGIDEPETTLQQPQS